MARRSHTHVTSGQVTELVTTTAALSTRNSCRVGLLTSGYVVVPCLLGGRLMAERREPSPALADYGETSCLIKGWRPSLIVQERTNRVRCAGVVPDRSGLQTAVSCTDVMVLW